MKRMKEPEILQRALELIPHSQFLGLLLEVIDKDEIFKLPYFNNRGDRFVSRAFLDDDTGRAELIFSDEIKRHHEQCGANALHQVVGTHPIALKAAFTTFQWLATNVGRSVLREALEKEGLRLTKIPNKKED